MKKLILVFLISTVFVSGFSQSSVSNKIQNLQSFLYQYARYENKAECKLWVNKAECQIEIGYSKFNLNDIKMSYRYHDQDRVHLVGFMCKENENCIEMSSPYSTDHSFGNGYYFGFKSKQACYSFMELVGDLRNTINRINGY